MSKPRQSVRLPLLRIFVPVALLGSGLSAQTVYDLSDADSGNISDAARWIRLSGTSSTTPTTGDSITIIGTNGITSDAQIAVNGNRTIANLTYGTQSDESDIARTIIFRGSGNDNTRAFGLTGDLTKYDSGTLSFRNNNTSMLQVTIDGNVSLHGGVLHFGTNTHDGLSALHIGGTTTITGGTLNLRLGSDASLGALVMDGGTLNLNTNSAVNAESGRTISVRSLNGGGGTIGENASTTGSGITLTLAVTGNEGGTHTYAGTITDGTGQDAVAFKMAGNGTQILSGANTYTGGTIVESGALFVRNTVGSGVGTGSVVVKSGAVFGGDGIVALGGSNSVTVESGGIVAADGGPLRIDGAGTTGPLLVMEEGARFSFDFSGGDDAMIDFWNYAGPSDLVFNDTVLDFSGLTTEGVYTLFRFYSDSGTTLIGSSIVGGLVLGSGLEQFETAFLTYGPNGITLTVGSAPIPEPAALGLLLGAAGLVAVGGRRRR
jgi:autotransporter-associated beta strand repeat